MENEVLGHNRPVIVRSRDAGVLCGYLEKYSGSTVHLNHARQMWQWKALKAGTLLDCAQHGVAVNGSKFSTPVESIIIFNACAIIDCTAEAVDTFGAVKWA